MDKPLYDIQGKRITVGSLVAYPAATTNGEVTRVAMALGRVNAVRPGRIFCAIVVDDVLSTGAVSPENVVVLEEPVWPNSSTP